MSIRRSWLPVLAALFCCVVAGCSRRSTLMPWPPITDPVVFGDAFGKNIGFQAFAGSKLTGLSIDSTTKYQGAASIKLTVPAPGDPTGGYTGGALLTPANRVRDLSGYNALTFFVKASRPVNFDVAGLGNDNTGTSRFTAQRIAIPITTAWTQVYIPIPLPARLEAEGGMFFFAEGPQSGVGLTMWIDEVRFVNTPLITNPRPTLAPLSLSTLVGSTVSLFGATRTTFNVGGVDQIVTHLPGYFTFESSNPLVASVDGSIIHVQSPGSSSISAKLGSVPVTGVVTLSSTAPPTVGPPNPLPPAADVLSLFSNTYPNATVDTWSANWDQADVSDILVAGNPAKVYTNLLFAGIEFITHPIDASSMTHVHLDVWTPGGTVFRVKLVQFTTDGSFESESELQFNTGTTPSFSPGAWVGLDIPLANFAALTGRDRLSQLILSGDMRTAFVDNVYFHK